jgi:phage antirepressor YoqD-like protein
MSLDDLLIAIIIIGIGLSGAYLRAELVLHQRSQAAERQKLTVQRELHANRLTIKQILTEPKIRHLQRYLPSEWSVNLREFQGSTKLTESK